MCMGCVLGSVLVPLDVYQALDVFQTARRRFVGCSWAARRLLAETVCRGPFVEALLSRPNVTQRALGSKSFHVPKWLICRTPF